MRKEKIGRQKSYTNWFGRIMELFRCLLTLTRPNKQSPNIYKNSGFPGQMLCNYPGITSLTFVRRTFSLKLFLILHISLQKKIPPPLVGPLVRNHVRGILPPALAATPPGAPGCGPLQCPPGPGRGGGSGGTAHGWTPQRAESRVGVPVSDLKSSSLRKYPFAQAPRGLVRTATLHNYIFCPKKSGVVQAPAHVEKV